MPDLADALPTGRLTAAAAMDDEFGERLRESARLVFRVAYSVLRQRAEAEDVAQETFARAYERIGRLRDRERFRAWIVRIAWRLAIDRQRGNRRRWRREQAVPPTPVPTIEELAVSREMAARVWEAIDGLPEPLRLVVILAGIEEHDVKDVAGLVGIPEGTVKSRLHTARKRLAESLRCLMRPEAR